MRLVSTMILFLFSTALAWSADLKCPDSSNSSFIRLTPELLEKLKSEPKSFEVRKSEADWCLGDKTRRPFAVIQRKIGSEKFYFVPLFFDKFEQKSPSVLVVSIQKYEWLGLSLAPICATDCDGLHMKAIGEGPLPPHRLVIKNWDPIEGKDAMIDSVPIPEGVFFQDWKKTSRLSGKKSTENLMLGRAPLLMIAPNQFSIETVQAMREIKKQGEGPVVWLNRGPFKEPYIPDVSATTNTNLTVDRILKEKSDGIKIYFSGSEKELLQWSCPKLAELKIEALIPHETGKKNIRPIRWTAATFESFRKQIHPTLDSLPSIRTRPVYVLGMGQDDPRAKAVAVRMNELGWSDVMILPGGLSQLFFSVCEASDIRDLYAR